MSEISRGFVGPDGPEDGGAPQQPAAIPKPAEEAATLPVSRTLLEADPDAATSVETSWAPERIAGRSEGGRTGLWLAVGMMALLFGWVTLSVTWLVISLWHQSGLLGGLALILFLAALGMLTWGAYGEVRAYLRLRQVDELRSLVESNGTGVAHAKNVARSWLNEVRLDSALRADAAVALACAATADDVRAVLRNRVLPQLKAQAKTIGRRAAADGAVAVALCPHPALDGIIAAVRAILMIRQVAGLFGLRPGIGVTLLLFRRVAGIAASVGGVDLLSQSLADAVLTTEMPVLKHVVHAIPGSGVAAIRLYRLAGVTAEACSPVAKLS